MNIMNRANTHGNAMWTPEYQQQIEQLQQQDDLGDLEEIQDNGGGQEHIRYYKPQAMGFTHAQQIDPLVISADNSYQQQPASQREDDVYGQAYLGGKPKTKKQQLMTSDVQFEQQ